jgi:hypothetical protein
VNSLEMAGVKAINTISTFSKRQFERPPVLTSVATVGADHVQTMA